MTEENRLPGAQRVFNAAKMAWSRARDTAGFERKKALGKTKPGPQAASAAPQTGTHVFIVPSFSHLNEFIELMIKMGNMLHQARQDNSKLLTNPAGIVLDKAISAFVSSVLEACDLPLAEAA